MVCWRCYKKTGQHNKKTSFKAVILIIKTLIELVILRFRPLLVRPFFMYWLPILTGNVNGIMAGKICADVVFFFHYELRSNETQNYF
jgi:hypothetical protein